MGQPLTGSWLKLRRALGHLKALHGEIERFHKTQPWSAAEVFNQNTGAYRLVIDKFTTPPKEWSVVVGEIIHNLRSALDHAVWQMAIANGNAPPPYPLPKKSPWKKLQFPIFLDKIDFAAQAPGLIWGISDKARTFVERVQPFDAPDHPLWWLGELSNIDKHRTLAITSAYLYKVMLHRPPGTFITPHFIHPEGFLDGKTEVAHVTLSPIPKPPVNMGHIQIMVVFGHGMPAEGRGITHVLGRMGMEAEKILKGASPHARLRP